MTFKLIHFHIDTFHISIFMYGEQASGTMCKGCPDVRKFTGVHSVALY